MPVERKTPQTIIPLTYGVMPRARKYEELPHLAPVRLASDTLFSVNAAAHLQNQHKEADMYIPAASFNTVLPNQSEPIHEGILITEHLTHRPHNPVAVEKITATSEALNTYTQIRDIAEKQTNGELGDVTIVHAPWQGPDVRSLMKLQNVNGQAIAYDEVENTNYSQTAFFARQRKTLSHHLKTGMSYGLSILNMIDRKGVVRGKMAEKGIGISDISHRGYESEAYQAVLKREEKRKLASNK